MLLAPQRVQQTGSRLNNDQILDRVEAQNAIWRFHDTAMTAVQHVGSIS